MRISRTLPAFAALLLVTACSTDSAEILTPVAENSAKSGGWIGSGNYTAGDSTSTPSATAERGLGWSGSGNYVASDSTSTPSSTTTSGIGQFGSGN